MTSFTVVPLAPYSLELTCERYTRFPDVVQRFERGIYRRALAVGRSSALVTVRQSGGASNPRLRVTLDGPAAESPAARVAARRLVGVSLGAGTDVTLFYRSARADALLAPLVRRYRGLRIAGYASLWEALVTAILSQQVNLSLAFGIRAQLATAFGRRVRARGVPGSPASGAGSLFAFPTPARLAEVGERGLRGFRMSAAKIGAVSRLAAAFAAGELEEEEISALPDDLAIERLTSWKGVGRWTAETALLRGLARLDAFPAGDLGIVKYLAEGLFEHGRKATEKEMRDFAERWRPYRGLALVYCWSELARRSRITPGRTA